MTTFVLFLAIVLFAVSLPFRETAFGRSARRYAFWFGVAGLGLLVLSSGSCPENGGVGLGGKPNAYVALAVLSVLSFAALRIRAGLRKGPGSPPFPNLKRSGKALPDERPSARSDGRSFFDE